MGRFSLTTSQIDLRKIILEKISTSATLGGMWNRTVWLVWLLVLPLALILGYLLATPDDLMSFGAVGLVLFILAIPLLLKWHYPLLIFSWNAVLVPFFLPGHPDLWMLMVLISLAISVLRRTVDRDATFLKASSVTLPLLFLGAVVVLTAKFSGGIGLSALGSATYGGRKYLYIFAAILGFFALTAQSIPKERAKLYTILFFVSGLTAVVSNLAYMGGPGFYFLFLLFPVEGALGQAAATQSIGDSVIRIGGLISGCLAVYCALLAHNGIREIFNIRRPWKMALFLLASFASLLAGFRSAVIILTLVFVLVFYFEGLHRTRLLPIFVIGAVFFAAVLFPFVSKMPFSVQRALSVLPIKVDPVARADAEGSSQWRLEMWKIITPQVPQYFFKGKGYAIDPTDLYMTEHLSRLGLGSGSETAILAGDYHNGPLSLIIPFGIFGVIGFVWFLAASLRALYRNYRFGDPALRRVNAFLLAFFLAKAIFFFSIFGSLHSDLFVFIGLIGFSISLNGGIKGQSTVKVPVEPENVVPALA